MQRSSAEANERAVALTTAMNSMRRELALEKARRGELPQETKETLTMQTKSIIAVRRELAAKTQRILELEELLANMPAAAALQELQREAVHQELQSERESVNELKQKLENESKNSSQEIASARDQLECAKAANEELEKQTGEAIKIAEQAKQRIDELKKLLLEADMKKEVDQAHIAELQAMIDSVANATKKSIEAETEAAEMKDQIDSLKAQVEATEAKAEAEAAERKAYMEEAAVAVQKKAEAEANAENLKRQLQKAEATAAAKAKVEAMGEAARKTMMAEAEIEDLKQQLVAAKEAAEAAERKIMIIEGDKQHRNDDIAQLEAIAEEATKKAMQADNAAAEARGETDTLRAQLEATGANIEAEIAARQRAEKEATKAAAQKAEADALVADLKDEVAAAKEAAETAKAASEVTNSAVEAVEAKVKKEFEASKAAADMTIEGLRQQLAAAAEEAEKHEDAVTALLAKNKAQVARIQSIALENAARRQGSALSQMIQILRRGMSNEIGRCWTTWVQTMKNHEAAVKDKAVEAKAEAQNKTIFQLKEELLVEEKSREQIMNEIIEKQEAAQSKIQSMAFSHKRRTQTMAIRQLRRVMDRQNGRNVSLALSNWDSNAQDAALEKAERSQEEERQQRLAQEKHILELREQVARAKAEADRLAAENDAHSNTINELIEQHESKRNEVEHLQRVALGNVEKRQSVALRLLKRTVTDGMIAAAARSLIIWFNRMAEDKIRSNNMDIETMKKEAADAIQWHERVNNQLRTQLVEAKEAKAEAEQERDMTIKNLVEARQNDLTKLDDHLSARHETAMRLIIDWIRRRLQMEAYAAVGNWRRTMRNEHMTHLQRELAAATEQAHMQAIEHEAQVAQLLARAHEHSVIPDDSDSDASNGDVCPLCGK